MVVGQVAVVVAVVALMAVGPVVVVVVGVVAVVVTLVAPNCTAQAVLGQLATLRAGGLGSERYKRSEVNKPLSEFRPNGCKGMPSVMIWSRGIT